jgi:hypothetical protein
VGGDGAFYFENLPKGSYSALVETSGTRCTFALEVPASDQAVVKLGAVRCAMDAKP